jgi:hypothetical protein
MIRAVSPADRLVLCIFILHVFSRKCKTKNEKQQEKTEKQSI